MVVTTVSTLIIASLFYLHYVLQPAMDKLAEYRPLEAYWLMQHAVVTTLIVLSISVLTGWLLASRVESVISRPIAQLAQAALRVTEVNDYSPRLKYHGNDELGDLVTGFNSMLAAVEQRDAALQQAQQQLEQRVLERTKELRQEVADRRRAEKDLSQQLARISLLNQITRATSNRQDLESILSVMLSELTLHLPADFGCALLLEPDSGTLRVACCRERELDTAYLAWKVDNWSVPVAGSGWESPEAGPMFVQDLVEAAPRKVFSKPAQLGMQTAAALPLRFETKLLGILVIARRAAGGFSEGEKQFLQSLAEHVSLAGHQALLHSRLQRAYEELNQTQQTVMQHERLRALGQMASGIAHDINNALSPVSGFAEVLLLTEPHLSANAQKHLNYIKTASDDIAHIVSRLREFYRSRQDEDARKPVAVDPLILGVIELTRPRWRDLAQRRGISVDVVPDLCPNPPEILGVEPELREALTNLVFNALDAMPQGGSIPLRTRTAELPTDGSAPVAARLLIEIADTGTGMDEETRKRCLEPFFSTKGKRGTGLGLAMVYGTIQRHNGTIEIDSEPGRGTTMRLILPVRSAGATESATPQVHAPLPPLKILFVDDEPLLRVLIEELLATEGHSVTTADGGVEGLAAFREMIAAGAPPDVVITDLGMPQMDGRELTTQIKRDSPRTPVIMMTGWGKMMRGEEEIRAPVDALISKPPQMPEVQEALRKVLLRNG